MQVERACQHEGCNYVLRTKARESRTQATQDELAAHLALAHGGVGTYGTRERRAWVIPLAIANAVAVLISAALTVSMAAGGGGQAVLLFAIVFPQVAGFVIAPWLGIGILLGAGLLALLSAITRPRGLRWQTFFAAITAIGAVVWLVIPVLTFAFLAYLSATWNA